MIQTLSYGVAVSGHTADLERTLGVFRAACAAVLRLVAPFSGELDGLGANERRNTVDRWVHGTKKRPARFPSFDRDFPKLPSYLRRAAQAQALGALATHRAAVERWEGSGRKGRRPRLRLSRKVAMPLYKGAVFKDLDRERSRFQAKVFDGRDWVWVPVSMSRSDLQWLEAHRGPVEAASAPVLERRGKGFSVRFSYTLGTDLPDLGEGTLALGVDLGVNRDATCCVVDGHGTVRRTRFVRRRRDRTRLDSLMGQIRRAQKKGDKAKVARLHRFRRNLERERVRRVASEVAAFAAATGCGVIVLEHLDFRGKGKGRGRGRRSMGLSLWEARALSAKIEDAAHRVGVRVARVSPQNTSRLAHDGSGPVARDASNATLCTFQTGKRYDADLNAAKNIAARWHIRRLLESPGSRGATNLGANVPPAGKRTLSDLRALVGKDTPNYRPGREPGSHRHGQAFS